MFSDEIIEQFQNDAQGLASYFGRVYFSEHERVFPINPFQIMTDLGIHFVFRNFEKLEGLFLPSSGEDDVNIAAINAKRNITRQRFTAAHEICHFIKDVGRNEFVCLMASKDFIEKYADAFASAFLMPYDELKAQISKREKRNKPAGTVTKSDTVAKFEEIAKMLKGLNKEDYDESAWDALMEAAKAQLSKNY